MVECKYRGRVIGWLYRGDDGFPAYARAQDYMPMKTTYHGTILFRRDIRLFWSDKRD